MKKFIGILVIFSLIVLAFYNHFSKDTIDVGVNPGDNAHDFQLQTLDGESVALSDYIGKPVIVNFWATWCEPCEREMPEFQRFYEDYEGEVEILAVNVRDLNEQTVQKFVNEYGLTFPILLDSEDVFRYYQVINLPASYFIDENGILIGSHAGELNYEMLEEAKSRFQ